MALEVGVGRDGVGAEEGRGAGAGETGERGGDAEGLVDEGEHEPAQPADGGADDVGIPARAAQEILG